MKRFDNIFRGKSGEIKIGWLLALAACLYLLAEGVYYGYWSVYGMMMDVWGITENNVMRAPAAVRLLYRWSGVIGQLMRNTVLAASGILLCRLTNTDLKNAEEKKGRFWGPAALGAAGVTGLWCLLMLTGSVRLGWRITKPVFSVNTFALLLTNLSAAAAEGIFLYGAVYGSMKKRLPVWAARGVVAGIAALMIAPTGVGAAVLVNILLMSVALCLLTDAYGVLPMAGFGFAWNYLCQAVFGFAGASAALYETYPVNLYWLNGGNSGVMYGAAVTLILTAIIFRQIKAVGMIKELLRKARSKSPS